MEASHYPPPIGLFAPPPHPISDCGANCPFRHTGAEHPSQAHHRIIRPDHLQHREWQRERRLPDPARLGYLAGLGWGALRKDGSLQRGGRGVLSPGPFPNQTILRPQLPIRGLYGLWAPGPKQGKRQALLCIPRKLHISLGLQQHTTRTSASRTYPFNPPFH